MSILIGHASISEKGTVNGSKGDSTGKEVCIRTWYSKPWDFMAVHPDAIVREKHAQAIEAACKNDNIGYSQLDRNTANTEAKKVNYDISKIKTKCNTDCSALQNLAAVASGAPKVTYGNNGWTTSTMKTALQAAGYKIITDKTILSSADYCVRGAIYVKSGSHTVCGLTNGSKHATTLSKAGINVAGTINATSSASGSKLKITSTVKAIQTWLNTYYKARLAVDGIYGSKTKSGLVKAWQTEAGGLTVDGIFGAKSKTAAASHNIKKGSSGILVTIWQAYLVCRGYNPNGIDGSFGNGCHTATVAFQKANSLMRDGVVGSNTWYIAFR